MGSRSRLDAGEPPALATLEGVATYPARVGGRSRTCLNGRARRILNDNLDEVADVAGACIEVFDPGSGEAIAISIAAAHTDEVPSFGYDWVSTQSLGKDPMTVFVALSLLSMAFIDQYERAIRTLPIIAASTGPSALLGVPMHAHGEVRRLAARDDPGARPYLGDILPSWHWLPEHTPSIRAVSA